MKQKAQVLNELLSGGERHPPVPKIGLSSAYKKKKSKQSEEPTNSCRFLVALLFEKLVEIIQCLHYSNMMLWLMCEAACNKKLSCQLTFNSAST